MHETLEIELAHDVAGDVREILGQDRGERVEHVIFSNAPVIY